MSSHVIGPAQINLTHEELAVLHQTQASLAQNQAGVGSTSSRGASRASSQNLLRLDSNSLAELNLHLNRVMARIEQQMQRLSEQSLAATHGMLDQSTMLMEDADIQIRRYQMIEEQLDELELEFDRIGHIREIVSNIRHRLEEADLELERSQPSSSSRHRERHRGGNRDENHPSSRREGHRERDGQSSHRQRRS